MLIDHSRNKLLNSIVYFATHTEYCGKTKLFKLLFLLDFGHFEETGRSVTGLEYHAYKMGPVPERLNAEVDSPEPDMEDCVGVDEITTFKGYDMQKLVPRKEFDPQNFSKREIRLLQGIVEKYKHSRADDMVDVTHEKGSPWDEVYEVEKRPLQLIPYEYIFKNQEMPGEVEEKIREHKEMLQNYR